MYEWLATLMGAASAVLYGTVGVITWKRGTSPESRLANRAFALWWIALGGVVLVGLAFASLTQNRVIGLTGFLAYVYILIGTLVAAVACLLYYLLFLYTGRASVWKSIAVGYVAFMAYTVVLIELQDPIGVVREGGDLTFEFAQEVEPSHWTVLLWSLALLIPVVVAAVAYLRLYTAVDTNEQRYRIVMVGGSFLFWFGSSLIATVTLRGLGIDEPPDWWAIVQQGIGLLAGVMVLMAYVPPPPIRRRLRDTTTPGWQHHQPPREG